MIKKVINKRVFIVPNLKSDYFEQAVFYIKQNAVCSEDRLIDEANAIIERYAKKCEVRKIATKKKPKIFFWQLVGMIIVVSVIFTVFFLK